MPRHKLATALGKWNYYYTDLKGLEKVNGEYSLIMLVYNMKRCFKIVGIENLIAKIKNWQPEYPKPILFAGILRQIEAIYCMIYFSKKYSVLKMAIVERKYESAVKLYEPQKSVLY